MGNNDSKTYHELVGPSLNNGKALLRRRATAMWVYAQLAALQDRIGVESLSLSIPGWSMSSELYWLSERV